MSNSESGYGGLIALAVLAVLFLLWRQTQGTSNAETWEIQRDPMTGRLMGVQVHRNVVPRSL